MKNTNDINALLPQTQCGLCHYAGCKPYAEAIALHHEKINLCLPGGVDTLKKLGTYCNIDVTPFLEDMKSKQKPDMGAVIREAECIGCMKCVQACPVDAIIGSPKLMHTVITDACNGCELCIAPCPVDCIDMVTLPARSESEKQALAQQSRVRFEKRNQRENNVVAQAEDKLIIQSIEDRKAKIVDVLKRVKKHFKTQVNE